MSDMGESLLKRGLELLRVAGNWGVCLRLVGSAAVAVRCEEVARQAGAAVPLPRDLDFACLGSDARALGKLLAEQGYRQDMGLLVAMEGRRWTLTSRNRSHSVDVFFDEMEFSHRLDLRSRILLEPVTLPAADLLLAKLQYVEPTPRDLAAIVLLLAAHPVADEDGTSLNAGRVVEVLTASWGYYRTATANLDRVSVIAGEILPGSVELVERVRERAQALLTAVEAAPKRLSWQLRAIVGTRFRWYKEVEQGEVF
jgi:hypothetical protein